MPTCKNCKKEFDFNEIKRIYGEVWWETIYCSAYCKTADLDLGNTKRSSFKNLFKPEVFNLKPENFSEEEFLDIVADEVWNLDEWTPEGIMMMKHMILRLVVPKELQEYDFNTFKKFLIKKYKETR